MICICNVQRKTDRYSTCTMLECPFFLFLKFLIARTLMSWGRFTIAGWLDSCLRLQQFYLFLKIMQFPRSNRPGFPLLEFADEMIQRSTWFLPSIKKMKIRRTYVCVGFLLLGWTNE